VSNNAAHLDQLLPIAAITGKPRDFTRGDGADLTQTHFGHHPLETSALDAARSGTAKVVVDHLDFGPAEPRQAIAHSVL
jgi:hypothetical protein